MGGMLELIERGHISLHLGQHSGESHSHPRFQMAKLGSASHPQRVKKVTMTFFRLATRKRQETALERKLAPKLRSKVRRRTCIAGIQEGFDGIQVGFCLIDA